IARATAPARVETRVAREPARPWRRACRRAVRRHRAHVGAGAAVRGIDRAHALSIAREESRIARRPAAPRRANAHAVRDWIADDSAVAAVRWIPRRVRAHAPAVAPDRAGRIHGRATRGAHNRRRRELDDDVAIPLASAERLSKVIPRG